MPQPRRRAFGGSEPFFYPTPSVGLSNVGEVVAAEGSTQVQDR